MKKDTISKDILKTIIQDISLYILKLDVQKLELLDMEFERVESRRADIVAKINDVFLLHLEIQNDNDYTMQYRMLRYWVDISLLKMKLPIKQYVIYIGKEKLYMKNEINTPNLNYTYNIIDMREIDCRYFLTQDNPDALILAILCDFKGKNPSDIIKFIIDKLVEYTKDDLQAFRKYMLMLEELSGNRDLKSLVKEQEMLSDIKYEDLPSYEIGWEKGMEEGVQQGMQQGMEEGVQQGMQQGMKKRSTEVAQKLKEKGMDVALIAEITGLDSNVIESL